MAVNRADYLIISILLKYRIINISELQSVYIQIMISVINQHIIHFIFYNIIYYLFILLLVEIRNILYYLQPTNIILYFAPYFHYIL